MPNNLTEEEVAEWARRDRFAIDPMSHGTYGMILRLIAEWKARGELLRNPFVNYDLEWGVHKCAWCDNVRSEGHAPDCPWLAAMVTKENDGS